MNEKSDKERSTPKVQMGCRVPEHLRDFFLEVAEKERRDLSDVLRIVLEDSAREIQQRGGRLVEIA